MDKKEREAMIAEAIAEVMQARIVWAAEQGIDLDETIFATSDNGIRREVLAALMVFEKWAKEKAPGGNRGPLVFGGCFRQRG